jgi:LmbE family N-acetylglucosaminyl deacetylase
VVAQWTINRDRLRRQMAMMREESGAPEGFEGPDVSESSNFGKPEAEITHEVDVTSAIDRKRQSMLAHRSQMSDEHFLLAMPAEVFQLAVGSESYIVEGTASGTGLFAELFDPIR